MTEAVVQLLNRLHSGALIDEAIVQNTLNNFLAIKDDRIVSFMHHQLLAGNLSLLRYLRKTIEAGDKASEDIRKPIYAFLATYVSQHAGTLLEYLRELFQNILACFRQEQSARLKSCAVEPLTSLLECHEEEVLLSQQICQPRLLHEQLLNWLKIGKMTPLVRGELWVLLGVLQSRFSSKITPDSKRIVQEMSLVDLRSFVASDRNLSTIAAILRSLAHSLKQNYLDGAKLEEVFRYASVLMIPLKQTYEVPIAALCLFQIHSGLLHPHLMRDARKIFQNCCTILQHQNRNLKLQVFDTLTTIAQQFVRGITNDLPQHQKLFEHLLSRTWGMLKSDGGQVGGSLITIIRMLGIYSPLILELKGMQQYTHFFKALLQKCSFKMARVFESVEHQSKSHQLKALLYGQKQLTAFMGSLGCIVEQLHDLDHEDANILQSLFLMAIKQLPEYLAQYIPKLLDALVRLINGMHSKEKVFHVWCHKVIASAFRVQLDSSLLKVGCDQDYYKMIKEACDLWGGLLAQQTWSTQPLFQFSALLFDQLEHLLISLDCSYRSSLQTDAEKEGDQEEGIVNVFFLASETIQINNIQDYQLLCSLALVFNELLLRVNHTLYLSRVAPFYSLVIYRLRVFPKCIPLMKVLRALNQFVDLYGWPENASSEVKQKLKHFFIQANEQLFKHQQQYFFEALKMLLSTPTTVLLLDSAQIITHHLPLLLTKSLHLGQEMIALAHAAFTCLSKLFNNHRVIAELYLASVIPYLQKFIGTATQNKQSLQREEGKAYLLLGERNLRGEQLSQEILNFLGSLGGLCHLLVDKKAKKEVSWDYQCRLEVDVVLLNEKHRVNLARLLSRVCWLASNGEDTLKVYACQFLHAVVVFLVGSAANNLLDSKENLSKLLEHLLPTLLNVAGNSAHPSQQLLHSVLIQTIHFFANSKQQNAPEVQTLLRHLLALYNGAEDLCLLASKCLYEFVKWHINQQTSDSDYPVIKTLMRSLWPLTANRKARNGLVHLLTKMLMLMHRDAKLMLFYGLEMGALMLAIARSNKPVQQAFSYLLDKFILSLKPHMHKLASPSETRRYLRFETVHSFLDWIYNQCLFSIYSQQRLVGFRLWSSLLANYSDALGIDTLMYLKQHTDKDKRFLFAASQAVVFEAAPFDQSLSMLTGFGEIWIRLAQAAIFETSKLSFFRDMDLVYLASVADFLSYWQETFLKQQSQARLLSDQLQKLFVNCWGTFLRFIHSFQPAHPTILPQLSVHLAAKHLSLKHVTTLLFQLLMNPCEMVPNFNFDLLYGGEDQFLKLSLEFIALGGDIIASLFSFIESHFHCPIIELIRSLFSSERLSDREARVVLRSIASAGRRVDSRVEDCVMMAVKMAHGDKEQLALWFLLQLPAYQTTQQFVINQLRNITPYWQKHERKFTQFIISEWAHVSERIMQLASASVPVVRLLLALHRRLPKEAHPSLLFFFSGPFQQVLSQHFRDMLKFSYLLLEGSSVGLNEDQSKKITQLILNATGISLSIDVHEEALNLAGVALLKGADPSLRMCLNTQLRSLGNLYVPLSLSKLDNAENALRFLKAVGNLIHLSQDFTFSRCLFPTLKDEGLSGNSLKQRDNILREIMLHPFATSNSQLDTLNWLLSFYWDADFDQDEWSNFRCLLMEHFLKKMLAFATADTAKELFLQQAERLVVVIQAPISTTNIKSLLLSLQLKKGALAVLEQLYSLLPKPEKDKTKQIIHTKQLHKRLIKACHAQVKTRLEPVAYVLVQEQDNGGKVAAVVREYVCSSYNCLLTVFLGTQSNRQQFRLFLLESSKECFWERLVDPSQEDFHFQVETEFEMMEALPTPPNAQQAVRQRIKQKYFAASLHVIDEGLQEEEEEENGKQPRQVSHSVLELDPLNRHPCMINLLRLVDYLSATGEGQANPSWMKPINEVLGRDCSLGVRLLLTKLLLNREQVFTQSFWGDHLLTYLNLKQTGGKYVHYFMRDAVKRLLKLMHDGYHPDTKLLHALTMRIIRALPHVNSFTYSDNIDILCILLECPNNWVDRGVLTKMLIAEDKQWRLCAVIVLKLCLAAKVPMLSEQEHSQPGSRPLGFYCEMRKFGVFKPIFELIQQSSKKYCIAAAGLLGEYLAFIYASDLPQLNKDQIFRFITAYVSSLAQTEINRPAKQRFTLTLLHVVQRFPNIIADERVFNATDSGLAQFTKEDRALLLRSLQAYVSHLSSLGHVANIMITVRKFVEAILVDTIEVQLRFSSLMLACSDHRLLVCKQVFDTYYFVLQRLDAVYSTIEDHDTALNYYRMLLQVRDYLLDSQQPSHIPFTTKLRKALVRGLGCAFEDIRTLVFDSFERTYRTEQQPTKRLLHIFNDMYDPELEELWLPSVVPLVFSLVKHSSDFNRVIFQTKLEEKAKYYDWDFRNFTLKNSSQPYTLKMDIPASQLSQQSQVGGEKLRGMLKATQNAYMPQEEQVFTLLASQSQAGTDSQEGPRAEEDHKFAKINTIFASRRKRGQLKDQFQWLGASPAVQLVEDKLRFKKIATYHTGISKDKIPKTAVKAGLLRSYKVGQLPDVGISLKDIFSPLLRITQLDSQLASQVFLQILGHSSAQPRERDQVRQTLLKLLGSSKRREYNFVATLQKSLIELARSSRTVCGFSMKEIALASNTVDYAIVLVEQNIIQFLSSDLLGNEPLAGRQEQLDAQWGELLDLYQHVNEDDFVLGIILRIAEGDERQGLKDALELKKIGQIKRSKEQLTKLEGAKRSGDRFKQFIEREKIDCGALLSEWDQIASEIGGKIQEGNVSSAQKSILVTAICNLDAGESRRIAKTILFEGENNEYENALVAVLNSNDADKSRFHALNASKILCRQWGKTGELAFNAKHNLLQNMQKTYELQQFLKIFKGREVRNPEECLNIFANWSARSPNAIHDSNLTWVQILQSRLMFARLLQGRQQLGSVEVARYCTEWLVQVIDGMLGRGVLGYAQNITRKAIQQHKLTKGFSWQFYKSISTLKLLQLIRSKSTALGDYQIVPKLIRKEMSNHGLAGTYSSARLLSIQNKYLQGYLETCLTNFNPLWTGALAEQAATIYLNYEQMRKNLKLPSEEEVAPAKREDFRKQVHLRFAMFLEQLLAKIKGKFEVKDFRQALSQKNLSVDKLAIAFVQEFLLTIKMLQLNSRKLTEPEGQQVFSLMLKLLKVVQSESGRVGQYFQEAVSDPHVPKWLFLCFLPLIIRTLNSYDLAPYFRELFEGIITNYPEALVYHFNCSYSTREECLTEPCREIYAELHRKMGSNFRFIQALTRLQHPQLRLRDALSKFNVPGQGQNALRQLKELLVEDKSLGRYNRKFLIEWGPRIKQFEVLKTSESIREFDAHLRTCLTQIDQSRPEVVQNMKNFLKLSDGSTFFEDYGSSDGVRIEVPGTSYVKFQEPLPWKRVFIESFDHTLLTLNSIRKPKRIILLGSDQKQYMLLVKGGEDVRLDHRIQELFDLINRVLKSSSECSRRQLQIRRFQVVPMRKMLGVFEWVPESQTLRQFLDSQYRQRRGADANLIDKNPSFTSFIDFIRKLNPTGDRYGWHKALMQRTEEQVVRNFTKCEGLMPYGMLRSALQRLSKNVDSFLHIKNAFLANYAAACIVNYILGIGDRHLDNFLVDCTSASIVMIDFGYSFGSSVDLTIPQLIPFRLTKCVRELAEPIGLEGVFKRSMAACFQALSDRMALLVDYCDVFIDDPLMEWVWGSRKLLSSQPGAPQSFSITQDPPERKIFSKKIEQVRNRLMGHNPRTLLDNALRESRHKVGSYFDALIRAIWGKSKSKDDVMSTEVLMNQLISLATDKNIMGRAYVGLNLYI